ncbi:helix-turn-helix domain-containing protein [Anaerolinea thermophila]|uniref:helix-turn-helix domain-containing protein n=1 Tax=Anaerolinea thermophila TaxID=167964 RepID=UPI002629B541|nr:helix-turn-helix domain-containing protein [Anaerolinea thermophila]
MTALPVFIPLSEAARKYGLEEACLRQLIEKGKIKAAMIAGEMVVSEEEVKKRAEQDLISGVTKEDLPEYQRFSQLSGVGIGINEAAKKYNIPYTTLYRWLKRGFISTIGRDGQKVLINEQEVAFCEFFYRPHKHRGKKIFTSNGLPLQKQYKSLV